MTNAVITAQQGSTQADVGFKNRIINGGFDVWQRGTSFPSAVHTSYTADRWWVVTDGVGTVNVSRNDISALGLSSQYSLIAERSAGTNRWVIGTNLETNVTKALLGKTVTFSCKLREGSGFNSNISITVGTCTLETKFSPVVDGGSFTVANASLNTTSFTQVSYTFTIPANSAALGFKIEISATQAGGSGVYFEVAEAQLEVGSAATGFDWRFIGTELALCQRYFTYAGPYSWTFDYPLNGGGFWSGNSYRPCRFFALPVPMRATPSTSATYSASGYTAAETNGASSAQGAWDNKTVYWMHPYGSTSGGNPYVYGIQWTCSAEL